MIARELLREAGSVRRPRVTADMDTGCRVSPSCLHCPLALCIYEDPRGPRAATHAGRDAAIWQDFCAGWTARALARRHGLSTRQVFRIIARVRAERAEPARQLPLMFPPHPNQ